MRRTIHSTTYVDVNDVYIYKRGIFEEGMPVQEGQPIELSVRRMDREGVTACISLVHGDEATRRRRGGALTYSVFVSLS